MQIKAKFKNGIPEGMEVSLGGQLYKYVGMVPYVTRAGRNIELSEWETKCATCHAPMTIQHTAEPTFAFTRRCHLHKQPGKVTAAELEAGL